jgi:NAD(P) transhydrogenase subunit alpha
VPGRPAPLLLTTPMVEAMRPGSVVVDLAAESGGNCELSVAGQDVEHRGVLVHGMADVPSSMPVHASQLYSRNVVSLLLLMTADGQVVPDFDDEVLAASCVTRPETPEGPA